MKASLSDLEERSAAAEPSVPDGALSLPGRYYTSEDVFRAEMEHIHRRNWVFLGRADELPEPGDYRALETVGGPVILLRDLTGRLRAFANVCRHRGSTLLTGGGNRRVIVCPYHAWSYKLDGSVARAPDMPESATFRKADWGLTPIGLETWAGFIFVNFHDDSPGLLDHLGDLPQVLGTHRIEEMRCTWRIDFKARCNWKLLVENAMETYHTGVVHARTVGAQQSRSLQTRGAWEAIQVLNRSSIAVLGEEPPPFPEIAGLSDQAREGTYFTIIHPTTQFAVAQDCLWWLAVRPIAPDRSMLSVGGCLPESAIALPNFGRDAAVYYERWQKVAEEDVGILEAQQRGLASPHYRPGPLSWRDNQVHRINRWVLEHLPAGV